MTIAGSGGVVGKAPVNSCARFQTSAIAKTVRTTGSNLRLPRLARAIRTAAKPMTGSRYRVWETEPSKSGAFAVLGADAHRSSNPSRSAPIHLSARSPLRAASASAAERRTTAPAIQLAYRSSLPAKVSRR
jgi:hypothetical protein